MHALFKISTSFRTLCLQYISQPGSCMSEFDMDRHARGSILGQPLVNPINPIEKSINNGLAHKNQH